jgi:hypothetical protein
VQNFKNYLNSILVFYNSFKDNDRIQFRERVNMNVKLIKRYKFSLKRIILACMHTLYVLERGENAYYVHVRLSVLRLSTPENKLKMKVVCLTLRFAFHVHDYVVHDISCRK